MHVMGLGEGGECCERGVGCMINPHTCLEECRHIDMFVCRQDVLSQQVHTCQEVR